MILLSEADVDLASYLTSLSFHKNFISTFPSVFHNVDKPESRLELVTKRRQHGHRQTRLFKAAAYGYESQHQSTDTLKYNT